MTVEKRISEKTSPKHQREKPEHDDKEFFEPDSGEDEPLSEEFKAQALIQVRSY